MGFGTPGTFDGDLSPLGAGEMRDIGMLGNGDFADALMNNQLPLYCAMLDPQGNLMVDPATGLSDGLAPAIQAFEMATERKARSYRESCP